MRPIVARNDPRENAMHHQGATARPTAAALRRKLLLCALAAIWMWGCAGAASKAAMAPEAPAGAVMPSPAPQAATPSYAEASKDSDSPSPAAGSPVAREAAEKEESAGQASGAMAQAAPPAPPPQPGATPPPPSAPKQMATDAVAFSQVLIYTANLTMAVFEVDKALSAVEALGREMGGFLARRNDHEIVIRVPADKFFDTMKRLEGAGDMLHREVHVEDVTEQVVDLTMRLRNARAVRDRIEQLLAAAKPFDEITDLGHEGDACLGGCVQIRDRFTHRRKEFGHDLARLSAVIPHLPEIVRLFLFQPGQIVVFEPVEMQVTQEHERERSFFGSTRRCEGNGQSRCCEQSGLEKMAAAERIAEP